MQMALNKSDYYYYCYYYIQLNSLPTSLLSPISADDVTAAVATLYRRARACETIRLYSLRMQQ